MNLRHRRWLRQANGPLPEPLPKIRKGCCPSYKTVCLSCCNQEHGVWLNRWDWKHRPTLYHELAHWFDYRHLQDADREVLKAHFGWPDLPWWWEASPETEWTQPNCERFAKVYTHMLLHPRQHKWLRGTLREVKRRGLES